MAWGMRDERQKLKLNGGGLCPQCKGTLCLNGAISIGRARIVICNNCHSVFCAICGGTAKRGSGEVEEKYYCPECNGN